ncbi:acylphosphatase [Gracilibacillus ureilyticus]|uniref:Acylphosphatase n=1 Tax=Gracilibacillus ureilyticus TaxID=531814 RepID=A0A1H9LJ52_9BACI|nr:acylphosphatase [Gracilibacillus ureilyticus]SER11531.1 acylphosphatase [Gracilibacillus ureilyticus]
MREFHLIVEGKVQGVGFRYFTQSTAMENNITGWVKNLEDGSVEIVAQGEENDIHTFIDKVRKGPSMFAKVSNIGIEKNPIDTTFKKFEIRH